MIELKKDDCEHPIPVELRPLFTKIADAFAQTDFELSTIDADCVTLADIGTPGYIASCVEAYGEQLAGLDEETWERSCYTNSDDHWVALVDLATASEAVSDLTLHSRIYLAPSLKIVIDSVYVP